MNKNFKLSVLSLLKITLIPKFVKSVECKSTPNFEKEWIYLVYKFQCKKSKSQIKNWSDTLA